MPCCSQPNRQITGNNGRVPARILERLQRSVQRFTQLAVLLTHTDGNRTAQALIDHHGAGKLETLALRCFQKSFSDFQGVLQRGVDFTGLQVAHQLIVQGVTADGDTLRSPQVFCVGLTVGPPQHTDSLALERRGIRQQTAALARHQAAAQRVE